MEKFDYNQPLGDPENLEFWKPDEFTQMPNLNSEYEDITQDLTFSNENRFRLKNEVTAMDVAAFILKELGEITTMKLQKLVYYSQAWSLVWDDKPLFDDKIEAWINGPVIPSLYYYHKGSFKISSLPVGNPDLIKGDSKDTVEEVLKFYGRKTSQWLIDLTHMEDPWKNARKGLEVDERGANEITHSSMAEYYSSIK